MGVVPVVILVRLVLEPAEPAIDLVESLVQSFEQLPDFVRSRLFGSTVSPRILPAGLLLVMHPHLVHAPFEDLDPLAHLAFPLLEFLVHPLVRSPGLALDMFGEVPEVRFDEVVNGLVHVAHPRLDPFRSFPDFPLALLQHVPQTVAEFFGLPRHLAVLSLATRFVLALVVLLTGACAVLVGTGWQEKNDEKGG